MPRSPPRPSYERFAQHWLYGSVVWLGRDAIAFTTNVTGQFNLWRQAVGPKGEPGDSRPLTAFRDRTVRAIVPSRDMGTLFFSADQEGDEQFQIYRIPVKRGDPVPLTFDRQVRHELAPGSVHPNGRYLLYVNNARTPADMDVILHDLVRGTVRLPLEGGALWESPTWDPSGRRFSVRQIHSNTRVRTFVHDLRRRSTTEVLPHDSEEVVKAQAWTADGRGLFVLSNLGGEFSRLELVDLATGRSRVLLSGSWEVERALIAAASRTVLATVNEQGYTRFFVGTLGRPFRRLLGTGAGCTVPGFTSQNIDIDPDGRRAVVVWHTGVHAADMVVRSLITGRATALTDSMVGGMPGGPGPLPRLVRYRSFDGRMIPAFYYAPRRPPPGPAPAVLSIHGGPESQERPSWMYSGLYAYLTSRGVHVLAPNFRGSTGYGKTYQKLIHHDWGGNELKDLRAAAEWLRRRPGIDPRRLGVFGGSFGGFASLSCLARLPEYWKVGVDFFGPSNLVTFVQSVPPFWNRFMDEWVGNPLTEAKFLRDRSPISYIDLVQADLLIVQGARDPRVVQAESDQMVERLRARGRTVEYLVFPDEGHGFTKTDNLLRAFGAAARFLTDRLTEPEESRAPSVP